MDRRFFLFALVLTLSFTLIQNWFQPAPSLVKEEQKEKSLNIVTLSSKEGASCFAYHHGSFFITKDTQDAGWFFEGKPLYKKVVSENNPFSFYSLEKESFFSFPSYSSPVSYIEFSEGGKPGIVSFPTSSSYSYLCLADENEHFVPVGFWNFSSNSMSLFSEDSSLSPKFEPLAFSEKKEHYYVLENETLQLVFSAKGGSLCEINLPLSTKEKGSVVRPIEVDRELKKDAPKNDIYPQFPSIGFDKGKKTTIQSSLGGYYPLLRRSIINQKGDLLFLTPPENQALSIVGKGTENLVYQVREFTENRIILQASESNRRITKTYYFPEKTAPYCFYLSVKIEGDAEDLWLSSGISEVELISGSFNPEIKARTSKKSSSQVEKLSLPSTFNTSDLIRPDWIASSNGFFVVLMDPLSKIPAGYKTEKIEGDKAPTRLSLIDPKYTPYPASKYPGYEALLPLSSKGELTFRVYAGPLDKTVLKKVDQIYSDPSSGYNPDYSAARSFHGWFSFISEPFAKLLFWLMEIFYFFTRSWGFSIILLTAALKLMLYPLNAWSIKANVKGQAIAPKLKALQEKYKKDPQKKQQEIVKLYKEHGVNPFMGCLPILIQLPFLIGMFDLLKSVFALRGASFIPGWIDNLTAPDIVFQWDYPIFFIGNALHLLPILLGVFMFLQQKWTTSSQNMTEEQKQQAATMKLTTLIFTAFFYHAPSGLNIYWIFSTLLGIVQQKITQKKLRSLS